MTRRIWKLYSLEEPDRNGIYEVRLEKKHDRLSSPFETIMEFINGEWDMKVPMFINEYKVVAWRYLHD